MSGMLSVAYNSEMRLFILLLLMWVVACAVACAAFAQDRVVIQTGTLLDGRDGVLSESAYCRCKRKDRLRRHRQREGGLRSFRFYF